MKIKIKITWYWIEEKINKIIKNPSGIEEGSKLIKT